MSSTSGRGVSLAADFVENDLCPTPRRQMEESSFSRGKKHSTKKKRVMEPMKLIGLLILLCCLCYPALLFLASEQQDYAVLHLQTIGSEMYTTLLHWNNVSSLSLRKDNARSVLEKETLPKKRLNVLVLYPDDWRHDSLSSAGNPIVQTPFLDQLAQEGMRFTHNCVATSVCWISRATLLTGQYFARHQSQFIDAPYFYASWNETCFPYILQQQGGYFVGHIGKWQFQNVDNFVGKHYDWSRPHEGKHWYTLQNKSTVHAVDRTLADAKEFLNERPKDKPFVLTVAFYPPKAVGQGMDQYQPKPASMKLYKNVTVPEPFVNMNISYARLPQFIADRNFARERWHHRYDTNEKYQHMMKNMYRLISEVDEACRQIYLELDRQGILNETMIIFTTDNGLFHGEHGLAGKWYPYQESIRVPLIIRDPRMPKEKVATLDDSFTLNVDLAPTILGAAGLTKGPLMQGRDIADLYLTEASRSGPWRKEFFYEHPSKGAQKLPASSAVVRKDFKYMQFPEHEHELLFHLPSDPLEERDLAQDASYRSVMEEMRQSHKRLAYNVSWLSYASSLDFLLANVTLFQGVTNEKEKGKIIKSLSTIQKDVLAIANGDTS